MREVVSTPSVAPPPSPYSQMVRAGGLLFISGQVAMDPQSGAFVLGDIQVQTRVAFGNLKLLLEDAGVSLDAVVKTTAYLTDYDRDFAGMNEVYREVFPSEPPARATLGISRLAEGLLVEIEAIAIDRTSS